MSLFNVDVVSLPALRKITLKELFLREKTAHCIYRFLLKKARKTVVFMPFGATNGYCDLENETEILRSKPLTRTLMTEWKQGAVTRNSGCGIHDAYSVGSIYHLFGILRAE